MSRKISSLVPYYFENDALFIFLQKKAADAARNPNSIGFFGGGAENNESPEETMLREMKEELNIAPLEYKHFKRFIFETHDIDVYIMEVEPDFEKTVTILEGQYGKWFSYNEALQEELLSTADKQVINELYNFLTI